MFKVMNVYAEIDNGQQLQLSNDGGATSVSLSSGSSGQQQKQFQSFQMKPMK